MLNRHSSEGWNPAPSVLRKKSLDPGLCRDDGHEAIRRSGRCGVPTFLFFEL
jgi:hypothetical protein